jgi:hypothetical protein
MERVPAVAYRKGVGGNPSDVRGKAFLERVVVSEFDVSIAHDALGDDDVVRFVTEETDAPRLNPDGREQTGQQRRDADGDNGA